MATYIGVVCVFMQSVDTEIRLLRARISELELELSQVRLVSVVPPHSALSHATVSY